MPDTSLESVDRASLRKELLAQIAAEQQLAWSEELAADSKLRTKRLNHDVTEPDIVQTWKNLAPAPAPQPPGTAQILQAEARNELGDAELLQDLAQDFVFDHGAQSWMRFNGVIWTRDVLADARRLPMVQLADLYEMAAAKMISELEDIKAASEARLTKLKSDLDEASNAGDGATIAALKAVITQEEAKAQKIKGAKNTQTKRLAERAKRLRGKTRATAVLEVAAAGEGSLGISGEEWETHPLLFACSNGVVDLETGRLMPSSHKLYLKKASPYPYIGLTASTGWWEDHLAKVFCGNEILIDYFERVIGYSVTGLRVNKDIWVAYGPQADNGKSATFNTIKTVVGDYATTIKVDMLLDDGKADKGPDPDLMVIDGLRLGLASEAGGRARFSIERIKAVTGGDDVRARGLYTDSRIIKSYAKLWLHTNTIPQLSGYDPGFQLRLKIVPFLARFTMRPQDVDESQHIYRAIDQAAFAEIKKREAPYILAWVLRCARKFLANPHYTTPDMVNQYTQTYFEEEDLVGQFITCCCTEDPAAKTQAKNLYSAFKKFCIDEQGIAEKNVKSAVTFGRDMAKRYERRTSNVIYYNGISLKPYWMPG